MSHKVVGLLIMGSLLLGQIGAMASAADQGLIEETYNTWVEATNSRDIERWASYVAPKAVFVPPGVQVLETKQAILDYYRAAFADPHFALDCEQTSVDVARSGEMAWARGMCRVTFTDPGGRKADGISRWFKVWLKQDDGSWKCLVNTWNYEDQQ